MKDFKGAANFDIIKDMADNLGHVYYSMLLEPGADPEDKAIKGKVLGNAGKIF